MVLEKGRKTVVVFWDHPGYLAPEENPLDFMVHGKTNRGRHTDHPVQPVSIFTIPQRLHKTDKNWTESCKVTISKFIHNMEWYIIH